MGIDDLEGSIQDVISHHRNHSNNLATFLQKTGITVYLKMAWQILMMVSKLS